MTAGNGSSPQPIEYEFGCKLEAQNEDGSALLVETGGYALAGVSITSEYVLLHLRANESGATVSARFSPAEAEPMALRIIGGAALVRGEL